jgi:hypothetical protein
MRTHNTDAAQLAAIREAPTDAELVRLLRAYYGDLARADRTERAALYLHLGRLLEVTDRLLRDRRSRSIES